MKRFIFYSFLLTSLLFIFSCEKDYVEFPETVIEASSNTFEGNTGNENHNIKVILTRAQTNALLASGINLFNGEVPEKSTINLFGKKLEGVAINDLFFTYDQLDRMVEDNRSGKKLFASTNRITLPVAGKRTLRVGGVTDGPNALVSIQRQATINAVGKYNALGMNKLDLNFVDVTNAEAMAATDENGPIDIVVYQDVTIGFVGNFDGKATFPDQGNPGTSLGLNTNTAGYTLKNNTLLLMHELGHTLGMVHADFRTRTTCGNTDPLDPVLGDLLGIPEITGVCHLTGTDGSGNLDNAVMTACGFFRYATADFTTEDANSFRALYAQVDLVCEDGQQNPNNPDYPDYPNNPYGEIPQVNNNVCVPLPAPVVDLIVQILGQDFYNLLMSIGIVCP